MNKTIKEELIEYDKTTWHEKHKHSQSFGDRCSDLIANGIGSWKFIIIQTIIVICWVTINIIAYLGHWDPYPFILLNLILKTMSILWYFVNELEKSFSTNLCRPRIYQS